MANLFCASEVVEISIEARKRGFEFYKRVAKKTKSPDIKETFKWLASQEEKQIAMLQDILKKIEVCQPFELYPDEYAMYVQALLKRHTFNDIKKKDLLKKIKTNADAVDTAIEYEKDSLLILYEMKNFVRKQEKKIINKLIKDTQADINRLNNLKKCLSSKDLKTCLLK
ncbi:MAG: ferritin family protein [candidate division WOR-3 bacterium]